LVHRTNISVAHRWPSGILKVPMLFPTGSFFALKRIEIKCVLLTFKLIQLINDIFDLNHITEESSLALWVFAIAEIAAVHEDTILVFIASGLSKSRIGFGGGSLERDR
jgi:hypothetical protein